tara:strand:- start:791 stop:1933 length:1143 start_codon:yes stop_codon:yes gene_type:complete
MVVNKPMSLEGLSWKDVLRIWDTGYVLEYPKHIKTQFYWRTSPINKDASSICKMEFAPVTTLNETYNCDAFSEYFTKKTQPYMVVSFPNISKDTQLIVPKSTNKKQKFTYIKDFIDTATKEQQHQLWKTVAKEIRKSLQNNDTLWINTHGHGVPCLHIRLDTKPKYYGTSKLYKQIEPYPQRKKSKKYKKQEENKKKQIKTKKLSKRAKWRKKVEDKLYKQHKEARKRFGTPKCKKNEIIREGYLRKSYIKKNGVKVKSKWVKPVCIKDRGLPGKGFQLKKHSRLQKPGKGIGPLKKDVLKKYGYSTKIKQKDRRNALRYAVIEHPPLRIFRRMNAIRILTKRTNPTVSATLLKDMKWFRKYFDDGFKGSWKDSALFKKT